MAIQLKGTLKSDWGNTETAYIRIEFYKVKPWLGEVEYNPVVFLTSSDALRSKKYYYQDELVNVACVPMYNLEYESGSITGSLNLSELISFPLTGSTEQVAREHWEEVFTSSSQTYIDFDDNGNEVEETRWVSSSEWTYISESILDVNRIQMDNLTNIYQQCYTHLKGELQNLIPSSSLLDV